MNPASLIDDIVIVMLENRSFDSMLGYFSLDQYAGRRAAQLNGLRSGLLGAGYANRTNDGGQRQPFAVATDALLPDDLPHGRWEIMDQVNYDPNQHRLLMDGFVHAQYPTGATPAQPSCMGYFTPDMVPMTDFLAQEYRVCDRWFSAIPADTHPNRLMALSGYTNIDLTGSLTRQDPTIVGYLENLGLRSSITVYAKRVSFYSMLYDYAVEAIRGSERFRRWPALAMDWAAAPSGAPHVWVLEPAYADAPMTSWMTQGPPDDGHPPSPIACSERFLHEVYSTLISNPARWARTLLVITYDEHGGFYDHEPPLMIPTPAPQANVYRDFPCTGVRVPALIVSPLASRGTTWPLPMDHTSILRMIAEKFAAGTNPPYSARVGQRGVHSVWDTLDLGVPRAAPANLATPPALPAFPIPTNAHSPVARAFLDAFRFAAQTVGRSFL